MVSTNDWTNIPYYPTTVEKKENIARYLTSMGKQVTHSLLKEIADAKKEEIQHDSFNNFNTNTTNVDHPPQQNQVYQQHVQNGHLSRIATQSANPQYYHRPPPPPLNKYSPQYAAYIGAKPRAQASARIRLGGAF